jgi:hypothetical protein
VDFQDVVLGVAEEKGSMTPMEYVHRLSDNRRAVAESPRVLLFPGAIIACSSRDDP